MYEVYKKLKEANGISDYQICKALGFSKSTMAEWKSGRSIPKTDKLQMIADYFGVPLEYLLTGEMPNYYTNEETAKIAQDIFENKDLRILFEASRDAKPEDLKYLADLAKRLKATNPDG